MLCRALVVILAMSPAALPEASLAYDIKPKTPESAFAAKLRPDILGISTDSTADSARASFESAFKGRLDAKTDIQQQKFGGTAASYIAALIFSFPAGPKQTGEVLSSSFSSPASANRAYFIARNLTFAQDQQPSKADMIKQVMEKSLSAMLDEAKGANCDGALSVQLTPGTTPGQVGNAQFTLLDFKRMISAAAIDDNALVAEKNERNPAPQGNAPKL